MIVGASSGERRSSEASFVRPWLRSGSCFHGGSRPGGRSHRVAWLLAAVLLLCGPAAAAPDWRRGVQEQLEPNSLVRPSSISLEQAANKVRRETGGRVLSASASERGGERGYDIRVLLEGKRVKSYFVDSDGRLHSRD